MKRDMDVKQYMRMVGEQARAASRLIARADTNAKNKALLAMADAILRDQEIHGLFLPLADVRELLWRNGLSAAHHGDHERQKKQQPYDLHG